MWLASLMTCGNCSADGAGTSAWSVMVLRPASGWLRFANRVESYVVLLRSTSRITMMRTAGSVQLPTREADLGMAYVGPAYPGRLWSAPSFVPLGVMTNATLFPAMT